MADRDGFDGFVGARSPALLRTAYLLTRDWATAEDLLQTALVRAWHAWPRLDDQPEAYVRKIVVNTYASWWRRRWRGEVPTAELPEQPAHDSGVEGRDLLWQALGRLPRRQRAVVVLRYYEDLTEAEIARVLGVSPGTVKSQCSKALAHLRVDPQLLAETAAETVGTPQDRGDTVITEDDLRAALAAHTEGAPPVVGRAAQLHGRITRARRRRLAAGGTGLAVLAAAVLVPVAASRHAGTDRVVPARPSPVSSLPAPTRPVTGPWPSYAGGGIAIGGVSFHAGAGHDTAGFTITPTSTAVAFRISCPKDPQTAVYVQLPGFVGEGSQCSGTSTLGRAYGDGGEFPLTPGRVTPVTVRLDGPSGRVPTGTVVVVTAYQAIPFAQYPLPPRPSHLASLDDQLLAGHRSALLDSRRVGADGTFTARVRAAAGHSLNVVQVGPGAIRVTADGKRLDAANYTWGSSITAGIDLSPDGLQVAAGTLVTVTVTAAHVNGPFWLVVTDY